jgi:hypothetical protein
MICHRIIILAGVLVALALAACGPRVVVQPHQRAEEPIKTSDAVWQMAWVDPSVVYSDSIFTLIRASRLDSFLVAPGKQSKELPNAALSASSATAPNGVVKFEAPDGCPLTVRLKGGSRNLLPISGRILGSGVYKLTCDLSRTSPQQFPAGTYQIDVVCGPFPRTGWIRK